MPVRYKEILEYMHGYLGAYPLAVETNQVRHHYIIADRNGYRLGESSDFVIEEMVKEENRLFTETLQRKTFGQLIEIIANLPHFR
jgi:hypothetical protein